MRAAFLLFFLGISFLPQAKTFQLNSETNKVYADLFAFKLKSAKLKASKGDTSNLAFQFLASTADFLRIANTPDKVLVVAHIKSIASLIEELEKLPENKYKRFAQGDLYFRVAALHFQNGDYLTGGNKLRKCNKLLEENWKKYPNFLPTKKTLGLLRVLVGSVPKKYRFVENLSGIEGNIDKGVQMLGDAAFNRSEPEWYYIQKEARMLYAFIQYSVRKNMSYSFKIIKQECKDYKTNLFQNYLYAIHAKWQGKNDLLIHILANKPKNSEVNIVYLDFLQGLAKLRKLEYSCVIQLKNFVKNSKNKDNKYDAYKYLYWAAKLKGDAANETIYASLAKLMNEKKYEGDYDFKPDYDFPELTKCRLLQDGGYLEEAEKVLETIPESKRSAKAFRIEENYWAARIAQKNGNLELAKTKFLVVIKEGNSSPRYFARNSALELGVVYKELKDNALSKKYLQMALKEFPNNIEKAKGIKRKAKGVLESL